MVVSASYATIWLSRRSQSWRQYKSTCKHCLMTTAVCFLSIRHAQADSLHSRWLSDLAPPTCQRLSNVPNALEMLRLVHAGRPVIFDGEWLVSYLRQAALNTSTGFVPTKSSTSSQLDWCDPVSLSQVTGDAKLSIAVTPHGLADALHKATNGTTYFVQPMTEKMTLDAFFARLGEPFRSTLLLHDNAKLRG